MISRGQMYRQLYNKAGIASLDAGAPSIKYTGNIKPQMAMSQPDPMAELYNLFMELKQKGQIPNEMDFDTFKDLIREQQSSLQIGNMNAMPRDMAAYGGRMKFGIGSWFQENVMDKFVKPVLDPVAQIAAVIPNPYQPYAQAYTGIRAATASPDSYGGLQVGGFTPGAYGGKYGINPFQSGNTFGTPQIPSDIDKFIYGLDTARGPVYVNSKDDPSKKTSQTSQQKDERNVFVKILDTAQKYKDLIALATAGTMAGLTYKEQKDLKKKLEGDYEQYKADVSKYMEKYKSPSGLASIKVSGPRTAADVVRAPVMSGGIMSSRKGYAEGEDLQYKGWKNIYLKSSDAAELHPRHKEFMKRFAEETMGQDRSPEVTVNKAYGGRMGYNLGTRDPYLQYPVINSVKPTIKPQDKPKPNQKLMAGPDWYVKRVEILMELGYDYDTASEIAYDSDRYYDTVGGMNKGGRPGYALGDTATMAAQVEGLPLRNNQAGITELDLRDSGGFIPPVGIKEKADDIPAMLSNNEFVFTADAVRGMGDGDIDRGAQRMYNMMKKLEQGGRV